MNVLNQFGHKVSFEQIAKVFTVAAIHVAILIAFLVQPRPGWRSERVHIALVDIPSATKLLPPPRVFLEKLVILDVNPPSFNVLEDARATLPPRLDPASSNVSPVVPSGFDGRGYRPIVILHVHVQVNGDIDQAVVSGSCGFPELDEAAVNFVKAHWHFLPATKDGRSVESWANTEVAFQEVPGTDDKSVGISDHDRGK